MDATQARDLARQARALRRAGAAHVAADIDAHLAASGYAPDGDTVHVLPAPDLIDGGLTPTDLWQAHRIIVRLRDTGVGDDGQLALDLATETARRLANPANLADPPLPEDSGYTPVLPAAEIDRLVQDHLDFARIVVHKTWTYGMLAAGVDRGDALGLANIGLIEAARRYDPTSGYRFPTYAYSRIRGAIIDGVRTSSWAKRQNKGISARSETMNAAMRRMESLDAPIGGTDDGIITRGEALADPADTYADVDNADAARQLLDMLLTAPRGRHAARDREVLRRRFVDDHTLKGIAADLSLTESRICQIVAKYTTQVRDRYLATEAAA